MQTYEPQAKNRSREYRPGFPIMTLLMSVLGLSVIADDHTIDGTWLVDSVEFAGVPVPGLESSELTFDNGSKSFRLPDGRVEKGTYTLDTSQQPYWIDATTEGKPNREKGIFSIEGTILKLCLAQNGGERPERFVAQPNSDQILIVLRRQSRPALQPKSIENPQPATKRRFHMGFTGFVYDMTLEAVTSTRRFVKENADILAHHIEGVPWKEALNNQPFPQALLDEWESKKMATPKNGQIYLAVSPGRGELKVSDKAGPLPEELAGKSYDHPLVLKAYLNYCRRAVAFFQPNYLSIGIEVNEIHDASPNQWEAYMRLHKHVYNALRQDYKDLPIFASWTLHNMFKKRGKMLEAFHNLMPYNDFVAVSYYPFFMEDANRLLALDWMLEQFDQFQKPYAMVETNDAAEELPLPQAQVTIKGSLEKQETYYRRLLEIAHDRDFKFVISFVHQDYDAVGRELLSRASCGDRPPLVSSSA